MSKSLLIVGGTSQLAQSLLKHLESEPSPFFDRILCQVRKTSKSTASDREHPKIKVMTSVNSFATESDIKDLVTDVQHWTTSLDAVLFCASPRLALKHLAKTTGDELHEQLNVQAVLPFLLLRELVPLLARKDGLQSQVVFTLSSVVDGMPPKNMSPYVIGKYAALGLMKSLAVELLPKGIRINAVSPSMFKSEFLRDVPEKVLEIAEAQHPLKRLMTVDDVVPIVSSLLTVQTTRFVSGQNWIVNC